MTQATKQVSKWKPYNIYKDSGIEWLGEIPYDWTAIRLRFQVKFSPTVSETRGFSENTAVSFVPMDAVIENGGLKLEQTMLMCHVDKGYTYFRDGDVVVAKITPCFENCKGALADGLENGIGFGTTELYVLRPLHSLNRKYLFYLTISYAFRKIGVSYMQGAGGQKRVPDTFIKDFRCPIPVFNEQTAIATFLDRKTSQIDALIEKKKRQIELLKEKRSALISHAVTKGLDPKAKMKDSGIEWLGEIPEEWEAIAFKRLGNFQGGAGFPNDEQGLVDEEFAFYKVSDMNLPENQRFMNTHNNSVSREIATKLRAFIFPEGTIIFAKVGAALLLNRRRIVTSLSCIDNNMMGFIRKSCDLNWIYYWMCSLDLGNLANPGAVPSINEGQIREIRVPVPPLSEQTAIATFLDRKTAQTDTLIDKVQTSIELLREKRSALITAAVTGKIDVREKAA